MIEIPADSFLVKSYPVLLRGGDVAAVVAAFAVVVGAMTAVTVRRAVRADDMAAGRTMTSSCFGRAEAGKRLLKTNGI